MDDPFRVAVLVLPGFPLMAFSAVIEPLRVANLLGASPPYRWWIVTPEAVAVATSSGVAIKGDCSVRRAPPVDRAIVCSGGDAHVYRSPASSSWLRRLDRAGAEIGAVADATFFLARAGLMAGYRCTIHWQSQAAFAERFPDIALNPALYVIDGKRLTSAGGIGAFDMTLDLIERDHGRETAQRTAEWFVHERLRAGTDREALSVRLRTGLADAPLLRAIAEMERNLEEPLSIAALAAGQGLSRDTLERRFREATGVSPQRYYRRLRLERALDYLRHTSMPIGEVALACGYGDPSYFAKRFGEAFGTSPSRFRRQSRAIPGLPHFAGNAPESAAKVIERTSEAADTA